MENDDKKKKYRKKKKSNKHEETIDKRKGRKNGAAIGRRLSQRLKDLEKKKGKEAEKGEKDEKEMGSKEISDCSDSTGEVTGLRTEVEIEYTEKTVKMCGKKKKKKTYGLVMKKFVLHKKKERHYKCGEKNCKEVFALIKERSDHIREKNGLCMKKCGAKCETKWGFKKHMALHKKVKGAHECEADVCGKTFTHASYLKRHMLTHNDNVIWYRCTSKDCIKKIEGFTKTGATM